MRSVYVFCADGFEEVEGLTAVDLLRRAGIDVKMGSIMGRLQITGSHNISVNTDILIEDIKEEADMLLLPGGMPWKQRIHTDTRFRMRKTAKSLLLLHRTPRRRLFLWTGFCLLRIIRSEWLQRPEERPFRIGFPEL